MSRACGITGCHAPETSCTNGEARFADCPHFRAPSDAAEAEETTVAFADDGEFRFPWTGNVMGPSNLHYLTGSAPNKVLAVVGPSNAGKTSLLAAMYLLFGHGVRPKDVEFSGSLTFEGWENIASCMRWSAHYGPSFPAHTSSGGGRYPGMLHLSLAVPMERIELLAADAPGEWFTQWATTKDSAQAEGARWLSERADVFIVIADSEALAGPRRGQARKALVDLLRRVGDERKRRPVALVWSKCDVNVSDEMRSAVEAAATRSLGEYSQFRVSVHAPVSGQPRNQGQGVHALLSWVLSASSPGMPEVESGDPRRALLRAYGSRHGR